MLEVLHEDDDIWVYNKPSNISLLRDRSGEPCLWDELKAQPAKPHLVHRLDKGTSGCHPFGESGRVAAESVWAEGAIEFAFGY